MIKKADKDSYIIDNTYVCIYYLWLYETVLCTTDENCLHAVDMNASHIGQPKALNIIEIDKCKEINVILEMVKCPK